MILLISKEAIYVYDSEIRRNSKAKIFKRRAFDIIFIADDRACTCDHDHQLGLRPAPFGVWRCEVIGPGIYACFIFHKTPPT